MCEFANPLFLLLLPLVPLLMYWWLRQRRGALRFPDTGLLADLPPGRGRVARWAGAGMRGLGLALLVLALAGPRWPDRGTPIPTQGIALQMLVDVSGSMAERDFDWQGEPLSRLDAVKRAFHLFVAGGEGPGGGHLEGRTDDLVGLVTFATWPESPCPLTLSHSVLLQMLDAERPRTVPTESRTNIGDAIAWGLHRLEGAQTRRKVLVLLSDGEHNVPPPALTPRQAAQLAANQRIPVYTIDAGGEGGAEDGPASDTAAGEDARNRAEVRASAEKALQAVAQMTGGRYFRARDTATLLAVCQEIDRLERAEIKSFQYRRYYEGFGWFGLGAFVFLFGINFLELSWWPRLP
jgi:Ca-activated chloride channel family protein